MTINKEKKWNDIVIPEVENFELPKTKTWKRVIVEGLTIGLIVGGILCIKR